MIDCLNIYKFSFPFIKEKYEEVLFDSIFIDLEELLLYENLLVNIITNESQYIKKIVLEFKYWKSELIFNKTDDYFIPKFQFNLFFKNKINQDLIKKIIHIFETFWLKNYIFDYDPNILNINKNNNIINTKFLEKNFKSYNEKSLEKFLKNINKDYLKEKLNENNIIFYSFLYLIYKCFEFYKNFKESEKAHKLIKELEYKNMNTEYIGIIKMSETRLEHLDEVNIVTFKKYKKMLDTFFTLLK